MYIYIYLKKIDASSSFHSFEVQICTSRNINPLQTGDFCKDIDTCVFLVRGNSYYKSILKTCLVGTTYIVLFVPCQILNQTIVCYPLARMFICIYK